MTGKLVNRAIFVQTLKMRVLIEQLNDTDYRLTGRPTGPNGRPEPGDEVVADQTALYDIYGELGLLDSNNFKSALQRLLRPLYARLERPATRGWTRTRSVHSW